MPYILGLVLVDWPSTYFSGVQGGKSESMQAAEETASCTPQGRPLADRSGFQPQVSGYLSTYTTDGAST